MTTTNSPAGQPAYTAAQYEGRIEFLVSALELANATIERLQRHAPGTAEGTLGITRSALSTERAHRTAEAAGLTGYHAHDAACAQRRGASDGLGPITGESDVERARRLAR